MTSVGGRYSLLASCEGKRLQSRPATQQGMFTTQQAVARSWLLRLRRQCRQGCSACCLLMYLRGRIRSKSRLTIRLLELICNRETANCRWGGGAHDTQVPRCGGANQTRANSF